MIKRLIRGAGTVQLGAAGDPKLRFDAQGVVSALTATAGSAVETLGSFGDGRAAVTRNIVGKGMAVRFGWLPGLSYWCSFYSMVVLSFDRSFIVRLHCLAADQRVLFLT